MPHDFTKCDNAITVFPNFPVTVKKVNQKSKYESKLKVRAFMQNKLPFMNSLNALT